MTWTVTFYSARVERETLALPPDTLASFLRIAEKRNTIPKRRIEIARKRMKEVKNADW